MIHWSESLNTSCCGLGWCRQAQAHYAQPLIRHPDNGSASCAQDMVEHRTRTFSTGRFRNDIAADGLRLRYFCTLAYDSWRPWCSCRQLVAAERGIEEPWSRARDTLTTFICLHLDTALQGLLRGSVSTYVYTRRRCVRRRCVRTVSNHPSWFSDSIEGKHI